MTTDAVIKRRGAGYYDISFNDDGDIETSQSLDTAILMSLLAEQRADATEVPESKNRRGWSGNESTPDFEMGSKLWQFEQARVTGSNLAAMGVIMRNSLQWMIDDNIALDATVSAVFKSSAVQAQVTLFRPSSSVDKSLFELWNNTGENFT